MVDDILALDLVSDFLHDLWCQFRTDCDKLAPHTLHIFPKQLAVDMLRHQV